MVTLYTFEINVNTRKIEQGVDKDAGDDYDGFTEEDIGYATYNEDGFENVYAESLVSAEQAERLAYDKCIELRDKFSRCVDKILFGSV